MKLRPLDVLPLILVLILIASVLAFELYHGDRVYAGVWVWDVDIGGMWPDEAATLIEDSLGFDEPVVTLRGPDRSWGARPTDLGVRLDGRATLSPAYAMGRQATALGSLSAQLELLLDSQTLPPVIVYDERVARLYLEELARQVYISPQDAMLSFDGTTPVVDPSHPGRILDVDATLAALGPAVTTLAPVQVEMVVQEIPPAVSDAEPARAEAEALLSSAVTLVLTEPREGDPGPWVIPPEQLVELIVVRETNGELHATLNEDALRTYLEALIPVVAVEPIDARFNVKRESGQLEPIKPSVDGRALNTEASAARIATEVTAGNRLIPLVVQAVPPRYPDTATAEQLGITDLVAEGNSYFAGSSAARDHNIRLAASKFHGIVVAPGETFSFNYYLGPVTEGEGYQEALITAGEQFTPGIGGGVCQVSTTMYRAAFWGGYPIVERWYHYLRVDYYESTGGTGLGMDATVYAPQVDLKFLNDRPYPLLIQADVDDKTHQLIFRFYSTDDGRRVEMEGPEITDETEPGPPIYELDKDMKPGTAKLQYGQRTGLTATIVRKVYDVEGNLISRNVFVSKYAPRRAVYHYGPGYEPPEEP
jgi:vancomycin resistance protein YoaR